MKSVALARPWPVLAGLVAFLLAAPAFGQGNFGTIKGRLVFSGDKVPQQSKLDTSKEAVCSKEPLLEEKVVVDPKTKGVKNAIAYLPKPTGKNPAAEKALLSKEPKVEVDQKNCQFIPHVVALHKDQPVLFKSSDSVGHNIHYTGFTNSNNFAVAANGKDEKKLVKEARPIPLKCDIHPWMQAYMMVFDHPFFAVTDTDGSFEIQGVPAGTQNLVIWQEEGGFVTAGGKNGMPVKVEAGKTTDIGEVKVDAAKLKVK